MKDSNKTIIDAVIKKADALCPDSLALIGVYGSVAAGDEHEKSDLDLMILINDENGWVLADGFILDDVDVGYDIYCTGWEMLERDAWCNHAHLSKLFDSVIVYCKDKSSLKKLDEIKRKAAELLASDKRYDKADNAYCEAKKMFAEVWLTESLSKVRSCAGAAIKFIEDAVMLYNGQYFRKGTKRAPKKKELPSAKNLLGTYEEMYSNWKNKMAEATDRGDVYSSFMNLLSLQYMFHEIAEGIAVDDFEIMDKFNPQKLEENAHVFDKALSNYLAEYEKAGIGPKHFAGVTEFVEDYHKEIHKNRR